MNKTIKSHIIDAVALQDAEKAGKIADHLRLKHGCTYNNVRDLFKKCADVSAEDFEQLMQEAD